MALEDIPSLFKKEDQFPVRNPSRVTGLIPNGGPAPSSFVGNISNLSNKSSLLSSRDATSRVRGIISPVTDNRRVRSSKPLTLPFSYFSIENSGESYFVDNYFGVF
jgi:hypothetical protein